jgi:prepilin-type N-terminal cleavage/methylation domain-containing protein
MLQVQVTRRQRAFTLVETMIAVAIMAGVIVVISTLVTNTQDTVTLGEVMTTRDQIATQIERKMQDFANVQLSAIQGTAAGNRMLRACLDSGGDTCTATDPRRQETFQFLIPGPGGTRALGGTADSPVNYDRRGVPNCGRLASALDCPLWQVRAYFYATCPPIPPSTTPATSCQQAVSVHLRYQVAPSRPRLAKTDSGGLVDRELKARPPEPEFSLNPERYSISHRVGSTVTTDSCPPNSEQIGWEGGGQIKCRCRFGITQTGVDAKGHPICPTSDLICNPSELLQGMDVNGKPICTRVRTRCKWMKFGSGAEEARCPNAGWLEAIDLGRCTASRRSKKGSDRRITCANNRGYCCFYEPIR